MSQRAAGYFQAYINQHAHQTDTADRRDMQRIRAICAMVLASPQVSWAGSVVKKTGVIGSDLDLSVSTSVAVTHNQRKQLARQLGQTLGRRVRIGSHAVRLPATGVRPGLDLSFTNAAFGDRPAVDAEPWRARPARQQAARAIKLWTRAGGLPALSGWTVEALVLHLDATEHPRGLDLFLHVVDWLADRATPQAVEGVLRAAAHPAWKPQWSSRLPGRLQALANASRNLRDSRHGPETWHSAAEVGRWLGAGG